MRGWTQRTTSTVRVVALLLFYAGLLGPGCARQAVRTSPDSPAPSWPPPPETARVRFVGELRVPEDLGIRKRFFARAFERFAHGRRSRDMTRPYAVAVTPDGVIVVADPDGRCLHLFDEPRSKYRKIVEAGDEAFLSPIGLAVDPENRIYVSDSRRRTIDRFSSSGEWLGTFVNDERLMRPTGLAYDSGRGMLWVVDTTGQLLAGYDQNGSRTITHGRRGEGDGEFNYPVGVAVDPAGRLFVTDTMNFRVQVFDPDDGFLYTFGDGGLGPGQFDKAKGIALDADGHIYVVEGLHDVVHVYDLVGRLLAVLGGSGATAGRFGLPAGIHIDSRGRIFVADSANRRVQILQYLGNPVQENSGS